MGYVGAMTYWDNGKMATTIWGLRFGVQVQEFQGRQLGSNAACVGPICG